MLDTEDDSWSMFSLTENLSNSYVDQSKLLSYMKNLDDGREIGMQNFRSNKTSILNNKKILANKQTSAAQSSFQQQFSINSSSLLSNTSCLSTASAACLRWRNAAARVKFLNDPYAEFKLNAYPAEIVTRHRYNAIKKQWIQDKCTVKIDPIKFATGAMRACFRLKKLSNIVHKNSWEHASNYVAKCYMDPEIPRERYFDDIKLQMEAKLWAEIFNRHNPPKKIDMFQESIIEFINRPGSPLYHLEHYIEGEYIKYNSNSGFVDDAHSRNTPQAFSHFTFECSNHDMIVIDIQGVGDLYTDPQIHTAKGTDYGDGNLGIKGFALFFSSHLCNDVCKSLGLTQFDLAPNEFNKLVEKKSENKTSLSIGFKTQLTQIRGQEEMVIGSPTSFDEYSRRIRCRSDASTYSSDGSSNDLPDIYESEGYESSSTSPLLSPNMYNNNHLNSKALSSPLATVINGNNNQSVPIPIKSSAPNQINKPQVVSSRQRNESSCLDSAFSIDEAMSFFNSKKLLKLRPCCVYGEKDSISNNINSLNNYFYQRKMRSDSLIEEEQESILGKIHLELCKYHEVGRFLINENDNFDEEAAFFHLKQAANLGIIDALINIAKIYLQLSHDILPSYKVDENDLNTNIGFNYMFEAAEKGNKNSIYYVAKAYDTGVGLGKDKSIDWLKSYEYYQKILNMSEDDLNGQEDGGYSDLNTDCEPVYSIMARLAEMHMTGGYGLEKDLSEAASLYSEAADKAAANGKGRLANKYYSLSEQAMALADE